MESVNNSSAPDFFMLSLFNQQNINVDLSRSNLTMFQYIPQQIKYRFKKSIITTILVILIKDLDF
ncbi:hypothetical protein CKY09_00635 [Photorhabdus sp. S5P8-50]|nr:hypothetical protein CKY09_00635 [Photorhabdus sp. S5P8-50]